MSLMLHPESAEDTLFRDPFQVDEDRHRDRAWDLPVMSMRWPSSGMWVGIAMTIMMITGTRNR